MPRLSKAPTGFDALDAFVERAKSVESFPNINRYKPMPEQALFSMEQKKHRLLFGGNRGGKTYSGVADDVQILLRRHPHRESLYANRPRRLRFIGVDFLEGIDQIALPLFSQFIPPSELINGSWEDSYQASAHMLTVRDGGTCSFMSYEQKPNKFQGVSLDHIHFDEEPPKPIWDESMLRIVDTNGTWTLSETPVQQLEWVDDELIEKVTSGIRTDIGIFHLKTLDNVHLTSEALAELTANMSEEEKIIRLAGEYNRGKSLVFPEFTTKYPNVISEDAFKKAHAEDPTGWTIYASMDYGYSNPTAWLWTAVHRDGSIVTFRLLYSANIVTSNWAKLVLAENRKIAEEYDLGYGWRPVLYTGDPGISARNQGNSGTTIQQAYAQGGVPIGVEGLVKMRTGNQNIGLDKMHMYLLKRPVAAGPSASTGMSGEPWWQITDNCQALISEMRKARKPKQTLQQKEVKNTPEEIRDKDNHAIDGQKYLFMLTHDLRPERWRGSQANEFKQLVQEEYHPSNFQVSTVQEALDATMSSGTSWDVYGDDYASLE